MRTRLLGTIAAAAVGAGGAAGQGPTPPPPMPIGVAGGPAAGVMPASGASDPIPAPVGVPGMMGGGPTGGMMGGPPGMGMGGPPGMMGMGGPPGMGMGGPPMYPPPGPYGQQPWEQMGDGGINKRLAARGYVEADFLLWFVPRQPVQNVLVTSGPPASNGVPGRVGTIPQVGTGNLGYGVFTGFNIHAGAFWDDNKRHGLEVGGFLTELQSTDRVLTSDATGQPLFARPFVNAATNTPDALLVSFPTFAAGSVAVVTTSRSYGAEVSAVTNCYRSNPGDCPPGESRFFSDVSLLGGFRYFSLEEMLRISSTSSILPGNTVPFDGKSYTAPVGISVDDRFRTANRFYGGQVGLKTRLVRGRCSLDGTYKVALGVINQEVTIDGFSSLTDPSTGVRSQVPGGLYANSTNIGKYTNEEFGVIPEVTLNVGYAWTSWFSTHIGYNGLWVNRVVRPGEQYTDRVNPATVPTSFSFGQGGNLVVPNPALTQNEDFFLQGVNIGFTVRY